MDASNDTVYGMEPVNGLSQVKGSTAEPLSDLTVASLLARTVSRFADRPAAVFREQGIRWTWAQFHGEVDAFAAGLAALGLKAGDRLGIWSPNRAEWLVTQFATARIGVVLVNINPAYRVVELEYALNLSGCKALVTAERLKTSRYLEMLQTLAPELSACEPGHLRSKRLPSLEVVIRLGDDRTPGMLNYAQVLASARHVDAGIGARASTLERSALLDAMSAALNCHDAINIQFTSGTTGNPKGATLSHHNIVNNARFIARVMRLSEVDSMCIPVPLYHCFGMVLSVLACVATGSTMVFPGSRSTRWPRCRL